MSGGENQPLEWIQMELIPLANYEGQFQQTIFWWNPDEGLIEGADDVVLELLEKAKQAGSIQSQLGSSIEITEPLKKTTELAAVLAQYYWVVPHPVRAPFEKAEPLGKEDGGASKPHLQ